LLGLAVAVVGFSSPLETLSAWSLWQAIPVASYLLLGLTSLQAAQAIGQIHDGGLAV
jgi:hypothetical protein